jgi:hypothetical protein
MRTGAVFSVRVALRLCTSGVPRNFHFIFALEIHMHEAQIGFILYFTSGRPCSTRILVLANKLLRIVALKYPGSVQTKESLNNREDY